VDENDLSLSSYEPQPITECTPVFRNIYIHDITAKNSRAAAGFIYGLPEMPIEGVVLHHVNIETTVDPDEVGGEPDMVREELTMAGEGIYCKNVSGMELHHVKIETRQGPALTLEDSEDVEINSLKMKRPHENAPVILLNNVDGAWIKGHKAAASTGAFMEIKGTGTRDIVLSGNDLRRARVPYQLIEAPRNEIVEK
jgi:hypothetical protein